MNFIAIGMTGLRYSICFSHNYGGGSRMVWVALTWNARTPMCFVTTRINSNFETYQDLLESMSATSIFKHDIPLIYRSCATKKWLTD